MEIDLLVQAIQSLNADDAFRARLSLEQWRVVAPYLVRHEIRASERLVEQGEVDRSLYFLAQGALQVFVSGAGPASPRVAIVRAGGIVGEFGLFSDGPRLATVEAITPCVLYLLRSARLEELAVRQPGLAFELLRAAGAVMAVRTRQYLSRQITPSV